MKLLGVLIITAGFIVSSLASVLDKAEVLWPLFIGGLIASIAGIIIKKIHENKTSKSGEVISQNIQAIDKSLGNIVANIKMLDNQKNDTFVYDFCQKIDTLFADDLSTFVESRHSISHAYGLTAYADIMSDFAAADRYLNRVWSAAADGYVDESTTYIEKARRQFESAYDKLNTYQSNSGKTKVKVTASAVR